MLPQEKVQNLIDRHLKLEKELSSGMIDKKKFAEISKEYSDLNENEIINSFAASELIQVIKNKLIFLGVDLTKISLNNIKTPMAFSDFMQKISR